MKTKVLSSHEILEAAALLREGELVAFPTETVYGLAAPVFSAPAIQKIFTSKGRPSDNPLIVHLSEQADLSRVAVEIPESFFLLSEFMPGPLTLVLKRHPDVPDVVSGGLDSVAVRFPSHPVARALIRAVGEPLVAPSANLSGKPSSTTAAHVLEDFEGKIAAVIDGGACPIGIESTVLSLLDAERPMILRPGQITKEQLEAVLGRVIALPTGGEKLVSPGMKYRHYAPRAQVKIFRRKMELQEYLEQDSSKRRMLLSRQPLEGMEHYRLSSERLYAHLRLADRMGCEEVLCLCEEDLLVQEGLMNRLLRAASAGE